MKQRIEIIMSPLAVLALLSCLIASCASSRKLSEIPVTATDETQMNRRGCASLGIVEGSMRRRALERPKSSTWISFRLYKFSSA